jgi:hypothetical protein
MSTAKIYKRWQFWVILLLIIATVNIYRTVTKPLVSGGNPPIIEFESGRGHLQLYVTGPYTLDELKQEYRRGNKNYDVWQLDPSRDYSVFGSSITYGIVPNGFRQVYPANGKSPEPLIEGKIYSVILPNSNCGGPNVVSEYFMINNGKAVVVPPSKITEK